MQPVTTRLFIPLLVLAALIAGLVSRAQAAPPNDFFANRIVFGRLPATSTIRIEGATTEPGEPAQPGLIGQRTAWWSFTAPSPGSLHVTVRSQISGNIGINAIRGIAAYLGTSLQDLGLTNQGLIAYNSDQGSFDSVMELRFNVKSWDPILFQFAANEVFFNDPFFDSDGGPISGPVSLSLVLRHAEGAG